MLWPRQNDVDAMLEAAKEKDDLTYKVLLLGAGEAGKSTVVKQLKMIYKASGHLGWGAGAGTLR